MAVSETTTPRVAAAAKQRPAPELAVELLFRPLSNLVVAALLPLRVPPPAVVLAHTAVGLVAVAALARGELAAAALLLQLKTVLDNADGTLARSSGRVSLLGRYLDTEADFVVNALLFAALGHVTGEPWLALAAFVGLTLTLSADFNLSRAFREARGDAVLDPPATGLRVERALGAVYRVVFGPQDRFIRGQSARRLERIVEDEPPEAAEAATLAYHDRATLVVLANLGLSTQLLVLGVCLVAGVPVAYLWFALAGGLLVPWLQIRRERRAVSASGL